MHIGNLLSLIVEVRPQTDGRISLHLHKFAVEQWRIMSSIAESHMSCLKIDESDKHRNKHTLVVVFSQCMVQACGNGIWRQMAS
jgi:hypothetical protein